MTKVYFVRHGQSQANADGVIAGWQDSPLTEFGVRQARDAATTIQRQGLKFDVIIASPLARAHETANIIAQAVQYPTQNIILLDDLREKYGGGFEGKEIASLKVASAEEVIGAGAETFEQFALRVQRANEQIIKVARGSTLVVGHSGFYRMVQAVAQGLAPNNMASIVRPDNGQLLAYPIDISIK